MKRCLCLLGLVCPVLTAAYRPDAPPAEDRDAAARDLARLQGKWRCVEEDSQGRVTKSDGHGLIIAFEKDVEIDYDAVGGVFSKERIKLDPSKSPKANDTTIVDCTLPYLKGRTAEGIYQLEGDVLKVASPYAPYRERPQEFTTKKGSHFIVFT